MLTRIPLKQTFTYYFFLIFAQPSLELPVAAPLTVPTPGETQQDFTQSAADICHATKPGCHSSVGCASRDAICGSPCAIVSWEIPAVLRPGQPELSSLSPGSGCFLAPSCSMSDEGWEREPGHVVLWKTVVDTSQGPGEHLKDSHGVFLLLSPPAATTTTQIHTCFSLESKLPLLSTEEHVHSPDNVRFYLIYC